MIKSRLHNVKSMVLILVIFYIEDMYLSGLREAVEIMGAKVNFAMIPFLLNDKYFNKILVMLILFFFADAPFMEREQMYVVMRIGRQRWNRKNHEYIVWSSLILSLIIGGFSIIEVLPVEDFSNIWTRAVRTLILTDAGERTYFAIDYATVKSFSPSIIFVSILTSCCIVTMVFGMLMYTLSLWVGRVFAYLICALIAFLPQMNLWNNRYSWLMYVSPAEWLRCSVWRNQANNIGVDLIYVIVAGVTFFVILSLLSEYKIHHIDWAFNEDYR